MQSLLLLLFLPFTYGVIHSVIMAGSAGYINYRHHADTCHAYHLLRDSNVDPDNIITMLYDNVANDPQNPFPGRLFNTPSNKTNPGVDVYQGTKKDYVGETVTAANFLAVLSGDQSKVPPGHPVLRSGATDRVFVSFFDHGGPGILGTPSGPYITRDALLDTLDTMFRKKMYKELVFYVEACEAGSMFTGMPTDRNIYVVTAANSSQSSWGDYCPNNDWVYYNDTYKEIKSCLGDTFSNMWMANLQKFLLQNETLLQQFNRVKQETTRSSVSKYGDFLFDNETIHNFERRLTSTSNCL
jgi:legumain